MFKFIIGVVIGMLLSLIISSVEVVEPEAANLPQGILNDLRGSDQVGSGECIPIDMDLQCLLFEKKNRNYLIFIDRFGEIVILTRLKTTKEWHLFWVRKKAK